MISEKVIYRSHYSGENEHTQKKIPVFSLHSECWTKENEEMKSFKVH